MGKALRGRARDGGSRRRTLSGARASRLSLALLLLLSSLVPPARRAHAQAPIRLDRGRFTAVFYPTEQTLARSLLDVAAKTDTFPGLPRPRATVLLEIAPDARRFRDWTGPNAPEWGAAITFVDTRRVVMQGRSAGAGPGDPGMILRHELAHLALHEYLGDLPPRWFDEGYASYAAREWDRDDALAANLALALRGTPTFDELEAEFGGGATAAQNAYALAYRAIIELAALDTARGLADFFVAWKREGSMDRAVRASYGITLADFEKRWQQRTRRRYGALALVSNVTIGGVFVLVLLLPLYIARRHRDRVRMAALVAADEAAERAARESAIEALLSGDDWPGPGDERTGAGPP
ncbi:MAG TPA: hypothetical protein VL383_05850 [Gemmatimonadaceae bacterium]|jgi:hypothetical protein|nr:hypothetical protein [Gemmatimonadaceae bacterium]